MFDRGEGNSFYVIGKIIETPSKHESEVLPLAKLEQRCYDGLRPSKRQYEILPMAKSEQLRYNTLVEESLPVETGVQEGKVYS